MSEGKVKRWTPQCDESGAFLLESGGRGAVTYQQTVVLASDFDRVSAERDQLAAEAQRLKRIEQAALEMFALDKGGFTNVDAWDAKYEVLRSALSNQRGEKP